MKRRGFIRALLGVAAAPVVAQAAAHGIGEKK